MAPMWLSIRVELVSGRGIDLWPRPGRVLAASRTHTFTQLAKAIDNAFGRWDLAHLCMFTLADGTEITPHQGWDGEEPEDSLDSDRTKLSRLKPGDQFAYAFDFGDDWTHLCTVDDRRIDAPPTSRPPTPYFGWGDLPDQYGRRWADDDGGSEPPRRPRDRLAGLPPILPEWRSR